VILSLYMSQCVAPAIFAWVTYAIAETIYTTVQRNGLQHIFPEALLYIVFTITFWKDSQQTISERNLRYFKMPRLIVLNAVRRSLVTILPRDTSTNTDGLFPHWSASASCCFFLWRNVSNISILLYVELVIDGTWYMNRPHMAARAESNMPKSQLYVSLGCASAT